MYPKLGQQKFAERTEADGDGVIISATAGYQVVDCIAFDNLDNANLAILTVRSGGVSGDKIWEIHIDKASAAGGVAHRVVSFPTGLHSKKGENIYISVANSTNWDVHFLYYDNQ
jgi:hypothetical protein